MNLLKLAQSRNRSPLLCTVRRSDLGAGHPEEMFTGTQKQCKKQIEYWIRLGDYEYFNSLK